MEEMNEEAFGIDDLLDFSNEDIAGPIGGADMQQQSADSTVTAENFVDDDAKNNSNNKRSKPDESPSPALAAAAPATATAPPAPAPPPVISLIDRDFTVPASFMELEWLSHWTEDSSYSASSKVLLGSSARDEIDNPRHHQQRVHEQQLQQQRDQFYIMSPDSVLESCATSERAGMIALYEAKISAAAAATRSKRGRTVMPSSRMRTSCSATNSCEEDDDEEQEEDEEEQEEEEEEEEEEEYEQEEEDEDDEDLEIETSNESGCALSTESEVDDGCLKPPPAKRHCKPVGNQHRNQHQHQHQHQHQDQSQHQISANHGVNSEGLANRRCSHCQSQKTPQWRAGPLGPKTLCNACGVRFKSGRLLPEYRPAGSPTFVSAKHSNSHRKVLEMRRQREMDVVVKKPKDEDVAEGEICEAGANC